MAVILPPMLVSGFIRPLHYSSFTCRHEGLPLTDIFLNHWGPSTPNDGYDVTVFASSASVIGFLPVFKKMSPSCWPGCRRRRRLAPTGFETVISTLRGWRPRPLADEANGLILTHCCNIGALTPELSLKEFIKRNQS